MRPGSLNRLTPDFRNLQPDLHSPNNHQRRPSTSLRPPLGFWASKMLERDAEPAAEATDPSPAGKEPVTTGGGESGPVGGGTLQEEYLRVKV